MKKTLLLIPLLVLALFVVVSSFKDPGKNTKNVAEKQTCNAVVPTGVTATVSGGTVTVKWNSQGAGVYFTVGGIYHSGGQIPHSCPATSGYTFPRCDLTSCGGTLRVTAWCGTCQAGYGSQVSAPVNF
jgi:hypothetical protein